MARFRRTSLFFLTSGITLTLGTPVWADETTDVGEENSVIVWGRGESFIGTAPAASEGAVAGADLSVRPLLRVAELLETVPGLIAAQHSGSGKANQYFLRGFNLDHGTDFTTYIDDVPMNLRTHGHGQGYLDVNGVIPELIDRVDYRKGPYRADVGDFSVAGASYLHTTDRLDNSFVAAESGQYGWQRLAGGGTFNAAGGDLTVAAQLKSYGGPWELPEKLRHESAVAKYVRPTQFGEVQANISAYHATWQPTEQIPERAIATSVCANEFCVLDSTGHGETTRFIGSLHVDAENFRSTLYAQYYDWRMSSNPTYDYQIDQFDRRWIAGGRIERVVELNEQLAFTLGGEGRFDDIGRVGVDHLDAGEFVENIGDHSVRESSLAAYLEAQWTPIERLRIRTGLRADGYDFQVRARRAGLTQGDDSSGIVSPKVSAAYRLAGPLELYANWGRGFHSNDARGVVDANTPVPGLVRGEGEELGTRVELGAFTLTAAYWWLDVDSELKFVGDSNSVEPSNGAKREGYELVAFWRPRSWLAVDAVWARSHARFVDADDAPFVPGAVESAGELGISVVRSSWEASVRVRHLGEYPIVEDNTLRADAENTVNLRAAWKAGRYTVYGELLNVLDDDGKDIVYYYGANVAGLDPAGEQVEGRMSRAEEPRTVRFGVSYAF
jgi:outer membrane receptor protein involved in Fe transport